jgi:hypothetical protein
MLVNAAAAAPAIVCERAPNLHTDERKEYLMKLITLTTFSAAAALMLLPSLSHAASTTAVSTPAIVELPQGLDARKLTPGATIETQLVSTVHLPDGTKLPGGTLLTATVVNDTLQGRNVRLALRFTDARLKHGQIVPIKAMILDVAPASYSDGDLDAEIVPDTETGPKESMDVLGVVSGVDMHSRASGPNSGVFVSSTKTDVKLPSGTQFELAITPGAAAPASGE